MSSPYIGEIRIFAGNFAPAGWMLCSGQTLPISENEALYTLLGTTYGGDGVQTFQLPNLQGRIPVHQGTGFVIGQTGGVEEVTLSVQQIPGHSHPLLASASNGTSTSPNGAAPAAAAEVTTFPYGTDNPPATLSPQMLSQTGGSQPHENLQPYACINYIISLFGIFPSPS